MFERFLKALPRPLGLQQNLGDEGMCITFSTIAGMDPGQMMPITRQIHNKNASEFVTRP